MNKFLSELFSSKKVSCSICENKEWVMAPTTFRLDEYQPKGNYQAVVPVVAMICEFCGHVEQFSIAKIHQKLAPKGKNEKERI